MMNNFRKTLPILLICLLVCAMTVRSSGAATAKSKYMHAESSYKQLRLNPRKQQYRDNWLYCIKKFQSVYTHDPSGPWAAAGLYQSGKLYNELYKHSYKSSDRKEAVDVFRRIIRRYPQSKYRYRAANALKKISGEPDRPPARHKSMPVAHKSRDKRLKKPGRIVPAGDTVGNNGTGSATGNRPVSVKKSNVSHRPAVPVSEANPVCPTGSLIEVTGLRYWSNPDYTRIVIDAGDETVYHHRLLKKDPLIHKPQRLYIDLANACLGKNIQKNIPINDNLLKNARAGQYKADMVRVVADIKSFKDYKIFSLKNPFRIVIDVWGKSNGANGSPLPRKRTVVKKSSDQNGTLARQLALCVNRIVIDPGHGGRDYGAPGYLKGVHEKDVALKIAKKLAVKIRKQLKCEVFLTRNNDRFLTLEERTAIANTKNADLFISIHTNAARNRNAFGLETYFLNLATDDDAISVAARENATSTKNISDLESILNDLMKNAKINESSRLAEYVQHALCGHLKKQYKRIRDKGVKQAPFYVLLGARMPAILVETSFISNPRECKRLIDAGYQDELCQAIIKGVKKYIDETNPMAGIYRNPKSLSES